MRRHCLSGYLPKQVEKIRLQKNIELNSRDAKALGAGRVLPMRQRCELVCERGIICHLKVFKRGPFSDKTGTERSIRGWTSERSLPIYNIVEYPPRA